ncbi:hypothetical protein SD81_014395 [Tolypothrix campylonemoides VB511288]|nr:hypothetical protein SD81_014395 [Tolypothrix campylonemoides VB511288]
MVTANVIVEIFPSDELTDGELRLRLELERQVESAFYEAGKALRELRDKRLYRSTHKTFEEYCKDRFGFERRHPYRLIDGADIVDNLIQMCPNGTQILPTSERQVRPLTKLEREEQRQAWQMALEQAGGKVPTGNIVKDIVQRIRERTKVPNPYQVGEVCRILPKDNPELKGKSGCWCIVTYVADYSCTVTTWDCEYVVKLEHLKSLDYLEEECTFMQQLCLRLKKLHQVGNLDTAAYWILHGMGKLLAPYLTPLQEKLLSVLETEYGTK